MPPIDRQMAVEQFQVIGETAGRENDPSRRPEQVTSTMCRLEFSSPHDGFFGNFGIERLHGIYLLRVAGMVGLNRRVLNAHDLDSDDNPGAVYYQANCAGMHHAFDAGLVGSL